MSKSSFQKGKILYVLEQLERESDESHPLPMEKIIQNLQKKGIKAERKSIYSDIETLRQMGYDILYTKGRISGYCFLGGEFELAELKLLVDAVQASKFITEKKSMELIGKLETLTSHHHAGELQRQVVVNGRIKAMNESIYYNVDLIHRAIQENRMIHFHYMEWNSKKRLVMRRNGQQYPVSPWTLVWTDENYYLIGYDETSRSIKYYRVDKMRDISLGHEERQGKDEFNRIDMSQFAKETFGMFSGKQQDVILACQDDKVGVILDRFGVNIPMYSQNEGEFICHAKVNVSRQFFGWLTGIGEGIRILEPEKVNEQYKDYLMRVMLNYFS